MVEALAEMFLEQFVVEVVGLMPLQWQAPSATMTRSPPRRSVTRYGDALFIRTGGKRTPQVGTIASRTAPPRPRSARREPDCPQLGEHTGDPEALTTRMEVYLTCLRASVPLFDGHGEVQRRSEHTHRRIGAHALYADSFCHVHYHFARPSRGRVEPNVPAQCRRVPSARDRAPTVSLHQARSSDVTCSIVHMAVSLLRIGFRRIP
jgi:hypothetical protein